MEDTVSGAGLSRHLTRFVNIGPDAVDTTPGSTSQKRLLCVRVGLHQPPSFQLANGGELSGRHLTNTVWFLSYVGKRKSEHVDSLRSVLLTVALPTELHSRLPLNGWIRTSDPLCVITLKRSAREACC